MKLLDFNIAGFGKFSNCSMAFSDGLNVIYGNNEAGKSTIHSFIRAMLYGMERARGRASKSDMFATYEPWDNTNMYGGTLRVEHESNVYRIERNFGRNPKDVTVVNETLGRNVPNTDAFFNDLLCGMSETAYINTISIGQLKSATDLGMVNELRNYIANMNTTGNMSLDVTKASAYLKAQRKSFASQIVPDAAKTYTADISEIKILEAQAASPEYKNSIPSIRKERDNAVKQVHDVQSQKENLLQRIASDKQILTINKINSPADLEAMQTNISQTYELYRDARKHNSEPHKTHNILGNTLLILATLFFAIAAYMFIVGEGNLITTLAASKLSIHMSFRNELFCVLGIALFFYVSVLILSLIGRTVGGDYEQYKKEFLSLAKSMLTEKYMPKGSVSGEELYNAMQAQFQEYARIYEEVQNNEAKVNESAEAISMLGNKQESYSADIENAQHNQWELDRHLERLSHLKSEAATLKRVISENERLQFEIDAIDLAQETMMRVAGSIRDSFGLYLNEEASRMIKGITGGIYDSMSVDEELNVFLNTRRKLIPLNQVSSGTIDQIYLALRMAAAKLYEGDRSVLPLIFDDSFVNYDEDRLRTALKWLPPAMHRQILLFTCHRREAQLLNAMMMNYQLNQLD